MSCCDFMGFIYDGTERDLVSWVGFPFQTLLTYTHWVYRPTVIDLGLSRNKPYCITVVSLHWEVLESVESQFTMLASIRSHGPWLWWFGPVPVVPVIFLAPSLGIAINPQEVRGFPPCPTSARLRLENPISPSKKWQNVHFQVRWPETACRIFDQTDLA